jgi:hypothetical protein
MVSGPQVAPDGYLSNRLCSESSKGPVETGDPGFEVAWVPSDLMLADMSELDEEQGLAELDSCEREDVVTNDLEVSKAPLLGDFE